MNLRPIDWLWHVRGSLALAPGQSRDAAFDLLDPLFEASGTSHERTGDTLTFTKKDPAAQDRMAVFDTGIMRIEDDAAGPVLRYDLTSRALLFCLLAPLLFLGIAQVTIALGKLDKPAAEATKKPEPKKAEVPMNPIDKALGAPEPEKPKQDGKDKDGKGKAGKDKAGNDKDGKDEDDEDDKKPSPTPAYVFAGIFAALYVIGRILEAWLVRRLFKQRLMES